MPKIMHSLIEKAKEAVEEIEKFPFKCKGLECLFDWADEISELIEIVESVYEEVENGVRLIDAWEDEGTTGEEFFEIFEETCEPDMLFLEGADQDVNDPNLKDFLESADNYIRKLIVDLVKAMSAVAETVFHDYQISDNLNDK